MRTAILLFWQCKQPSYVNYFMWRFFFETITILRRFIVPVNMWILEVNTERLWTSKDYTSVSYGQNDFIVCNWMDLIHFCISFQNFCVYYWVPDPHFLLRPTIYGVPIQNLPKFHEGKNLVRWEVGGCPSASPLLNLPIQVGLFVLNSPFLQVFHMTGQYPWISSFIWSLYVDT